MMLMRKTAVYSGGGFETEEYVRIKSGLQKK